MAHTPGPWIPLECDGNADDLVIADSDGGYVCYSVATLADAELIAAAPELLAACKALRNCLSDWMEIADEEDRRDGDMEAIKLSVAAIANAEGRAE